MLDAIDRYFSKLRLDLLQSPPFILLFKIEQLTLRFVQPVEPLFFCSDEAQKVSHCVELHFLGHQRQLILTNAAFQAISATNVLYFAEECKVFGELRVNCLPPQHVSMQASEGLITLLSYCFVEFNFEVFEVQSHQRLNLLVVQLYSSSLSCNSSSGSST